MILAQSREATGAMRARLLLPDPFAVIGANMRCELFVAQQLEVAHHFIERCAGGRTRRFEPPATFGATKTPKTLLLNPCQLPAHGRPCRCAAPSTRSVSRDETFWYVINDSFPSGALADLKQKTVTQSGRAEDPQKGGRSLNAQIWNGLSGILHRRKSFVRANV